MPEEAVCDSQKSGVERNVLGRLLTLTCIHVFFFFCKECSIIIYLRGEVRLPGNLFLTARPSIPITNNVNNKLILILIFFSHTREHHGITVQSMAINTLATAEASPRAMEEMTLHGTTTLQHTTKRILGASGGCESRLLKNTKERSSPSLC